MNFNTTIPEFLCKDIKKSVEFYVQNLKFKILFQRNEDGFYFLTKDNIQLMLQQVTENGWLSHGKHTPFGNGLNIALQVPSIDIYDIKDLSDYIYLEAQEVEYQTLYRVIKVRQIIFRDPDGYLIRFIQPL